MILLLTITFVAIMSLHISIDTTCFPKFQRIHTHAHTIFLAIFRVLFTSTITFPLKPVVLDTQLTLNTRCMAWISTTYFHGVFNVSSLGNFSFTCHWRLFCEYIKWCCSLWRIFVCVCKLFLFIQLEGCPRQVAMLPWTTVFAALAVFAIYVPLISLLYVLYYQVFCWDSLMCACPMHGTNGTLAQGSSFFYCQAFPHTCNQVLHVFSIRYASWTPAWAQTENWDWVPLEPLNQTYLLISVLTNIMAHYIRTSIGRLPGEPLHQRNQSNFFLLSSVLLHICACGLLSSCTLACLLRLTHFTGYMCTLLQISEH